MKQERASAIAIGVSIFLLILILFFNLGRADALTTHKLCDVEEASWGK